MLTIINILLILALIWLSLKSISKPGVALALIWSMLAFEQILQSGNAIFGRLGSLLNFVFAGIAIVSVINAIRQGKIKKLKITPQAGFCFGLLFLAAVSYLWTVNQDDMLFYGKKAVPYIVVFVVIVPFCATDQKQLRLAVNTTIYLGALIMLGFAFTDFGRRAVTIIVGNEDVNLNPLAVASYAGYVGICALFSVYGRKFSPREAVNIGIFILCTFVIIKTGTRGQLLVLTVVCFIWLPIIARASVKRSSVLAFLGAALIACAILYVVYQLRDTGRWKMGQVESATDGRLILMTSLLEHWGNQGPGVWMLGLGNSSSFEIIGFYPHNVPVEVLAEEGILGFGLYLAFWFFVLFRAGRMMFSSAIGLEARVNLGILLALFCFEGLLSLKQGSLIGNSPWMGLGVTVGWFASRLKIDQRKEVLRRQQQEHYMNQQFLHNGSTATP